MMSRCAFGGILFAALLVVAVVACGEKDDDDGGLITLSELVPDPVSIQLSAPVGTMVFDFSADPLAVEDGDELRELLASGGIGLIVANTGTDVSCNLLDGTLVDGTPMAAGEYAVSASADGAAVTVRFFNEFEGLSIHTGAAYSAAVEVAENGFFTVETFTRSVAVTE
jgi:hypothetical protein